MFILILISNLNKVPKSKDYKINHINHSNTYLIIDSFIYLLYFSATLKGKFINKFRQSEKNMGSNKFKDSWIFNKLP